jgi:hypothetical protein
VRIALAGYLNVSFAPLAQSIIFFNAPSVCQRGCGAPSPDATDERAKVCAKALGRQRSSV